jgi:hypothetical protein
MKSKAAFLALAVVGTLIAAAQAQTAPDKTIPVTVENFIRAESDLYLSVVALKEGGFGKFEHHRELSHIDAMNRDTLYSAAVFDLDAGPVTITLPDAGKRFMSLQVINEDQYSPPAIYAPAKHTFTRNEVGTRYMLVGVRTLVDPSDPTDMNKVHALQDAIKVEQPRGPGKFEVPKWDPASQNRSLIFSKPLSNAARMFIPSTLKKSNRRSRQPRIACEYISCPATGTSNQSAPFKPLAATWRRHF